MKLETKIMLAFQHRPCPWLPSSVTPVQFHSSQRKLTIDLFRQLAKQRRDLYNCEGLLSTLASKTLSARNSRSTSERTLSLQTHAEHCSSYRGCSRLFALLHKIICVLLFVASSEGGFFFFPRKLCTKLTFGCTGAHRRQSHEAIRPLH